MLSLASSILHKCSKRPLSFMPRQTNHKFTSLPSFEFLSLLYSLLRSMCLTGNQRSASPMAVTMWYWTAWTGIQSMRFTLWQKISRANPSPASCLSEQLQSQPPSQVLFSSSHPEHPHTPAAVYKGFHRDQKDYIIWIHDFYWVLVQSLLTDRVWRLSPIILRNKVDPSVVFIT